MKIFRNHSLAIFLLLLASGCVTNKKTTYLQDLEESNIPLESVTPEVYRVLPTDNLYIRVITPDPKWGIIFNAIPTTSGTINVTEQSADLISYTVLKDGNIDFPYVGNVLVAGKTLREIRLELELALEDFVPDVAVTVKLVNNYISLVGDVSRPGRYIIFKDQLNIFQAIALAGDLDTFSNRRKVQIIRQKADGSEIKFFNLTDKRIVDSEYYYVLPNDVIYIEPMKGKFFAFDRFPYGTLIASVTALILLMNFFK